MPDEFPLRPAWVEVNLGAIERNTRRLTQIAAGAELVAMVKANAYGHGAIRVSQAALRGGATWLGVVSVGEGLELRRAGIDAPILVVGHTPPRWARLAVEQNLTLTVFSEEVVQAIASAARDLGTRARVHMKIDTGMTRLGVLPEHAIDFARTIAGTGDIELEGAFTHFAMADTFIPDPGPHEFSMEESYSSSAWGESYTFWQLGKFRDVLSALQGAGIQLRYRHCANSPATINLAEARFNLVRSGILIYGLDPSPEVPRPPKFEPALEFKTEVAQIRAVKAGVYVSYGTTFRTERPSRLAVIMIGYADGFRRAPGNYGQALVRGKRAPIAGRVCMDQTVLDVTDVPDVQAGDEVVLIGKQGQAEIRAEEVAERLGTNNYETVTTISARLERRYLEKS